jgi:phenylalanyl-tRNA synthetase alpha chain
MDTGMNLNKNNILDAAREKIAAAASDEELRNVKSAIIGKSGSITELMKNIATVPVDEKKEYGRVINELKTSVTEMIDARQNELNAAALAKNSGLDYTLPGTAPTSGVLHPITQMCYDLNDAFRSMGFEIYRPNEITSELYAFDKLNFPADHPARDSMDTYWIRGHDAGDSAQKLCLRPHLTGESVRYMQTHKPPFRFVYPGKVYRNETTDARHERAFYQYEALIVDKDITFAAGKIMIKSILSRVFGRDVPVRMRAGFFPFVEPGFEIDMGCLVCGGRGCSVCKNVGWLEIMPGGVPHPNVLRAAGIDPNEYSGFYVNIGLDRLVMMRYGIDDVRLFHGADLRFLEQFS